MNLNANILASTQSIRHYVTTKNINYNVIDLNGNLFNNSQIRELFGDSIIKPNICYYTDRYIHYYWNFDDLTVLNFDCIVIDDAVHWRLGTEDATEEQMVKYIKELTA